MGGCTIDWQQTNMVRDTLVVVEVVMLLAYQCTRRGAVLIAGRAGTMGAVCKCKERRK